MRPSADIPLRLLAYAAVAALITWPLVTDPFHLVVGGPRTDVWNSLWGLWFVEQNGPLPVFTALLDHPSGGQLAVADPLNAAWALPLTRAFGPVAAYAAVVLGNLVMGGFFADRLGKAMGGGGWVAGLGFMLAPLSLAHLNNGSSEAVSIGWLPLACLAVIRAVEGGGWAWRIGAGLALFATALGGWYAGVGAWLFAGAVLLTGWAGVSPRDRALRLLPGFVLALALTLPVAAHIRAVALAADGLVDIKQATDLGRIRRTLGAADPRAFFWPGSFRSPDFAALEGNPSDFVHTTYLGFVLLGLAIANSLRLAKQGLKGRRLAWWLAIAGGVILALGPVLVLDGRPVGLGAKAFSLPLPYLALEALPGFGSLSLLYRLSGIAVLGLCALADRAKPWWALVIVAETLLLSSARGLPAVSPVPDPQPFAVLRADPEGAVLDLPPTASREYLFEQSLHGHPRVGSLNSGLNLPGLKLGQVARQVRDGALPPEALADMARGYQIRFIIQHKNQLMEDEWVEASTAFRKYGVVVAEDDRVRVIKLY